MTTSVCPWTTSCHSVLKTNVWLETADEQEGLVVELAAEGAGCVENPCGELRQWIVRTRCNDLVEALDAELLSTFIGDFKDAVGGDDEEITGRCVEREAIELRDRKKTDGKLRLLKLRDGLRGGVPVNDRRAGGERAEDVAVGAETEAGERCEHLRLLDLRQNGVEAVEQKRDCLTRLALAGVQERGACR